ncbi:MAG: F0F1 ATP synthase subunit B [Ferrimicrobium sp.]
MLVGVVQQSPNPILPSSGEMIWSVISFAILLVVLAKFAFPPIAKAMTRRSETIRNDLETAEQVRREAEAVLRQREVALGEARQQAHQIVEDSRAVGEALRAEAVARGEREVVVLHEQARAGLAAERSRLVIELRTETTALALELARRILVQEIERTSVDPLIEAFLQEASSEDR